MMNKLFIFEKRRLLLTAKLIFAALPLLLGAVFYYGTATFQTLLFCIIGGFLGSFITALLLKKSIDLSFIGYSFFLAMAFGKNVGFLIPLLTAFLTLFLISLLQGITKLPHIKVLPIAFLVFIIIGNTQTPGMLIINDIIEKGVTVKSLIIGSKGNFPIGLSSSGLLIISAIILAFEKLISLKSAVISAAAYLLVLSCFYREGDINQLTYLSFFILDAKLLLPILFVSFSGSTRGIVRYISGILLGGSSALLISYKIWFGGYIALVTLSLLLPFFDMLSAAGNKKKTKRSKKTNQTECVIKQTFTPKVYLFLRKDGNKSYDESHENCLSLLNKGFSELYGREMPEIKKDEKGKPYFVGGEAFFSISHCEGLSAVAISSKEIGVDGERIDRVIPENVAKRYLDVGSVSEWTKFESFSKLIGEGIFTKTTLDRMQNEHYSSATLQFGEHTLSICSFGDLSFTVIEK